MKHESDRRSPNEHADAEMNLIEPLRRDFTPDYFTESDKRLLSERVKRTIGKALSK